MSCSKLDQQIDGNYNRLEKKYEEQQIAKKAHNDFVVKFDQQLEAEMKRRAEVSISLNDGDDDGNGDEAEKALQMFAENKRRAAVYFDLYEQLEKQQASEIKVDKKFRENGFPLNFPVLTQVNNFLSIQ